MKLKPVKYGKLSPRQQEIYNFQKLAGVLADYGFNCIKLHDDWQGADFLAYHKDGGQTLKVQLKTRVTIDKKYQGKDIYMAFQVKRKTWYLVPHDELVKAIEETRPKWLNSESWNDKGICHSESPSLELLERLSGYAVEAV